MQTKIDLITSVMNYKIGKLVGVETKEQKIFRFVGNKTPWKIYFSRAQPDRNGVCECAMKHLVPVSGTKSDH